MTSTVSPRIQRRPAVILAIIFTLILAGCGAKLDTVFNLNEDGSGNRVITAVLEADELENIQGSIEDLDASVVSHKPDVIDYSGITAEGENYIATFTISFDSPEDYRSKVQQLFNAGDKDWDDSNLVFTSPDARFVKGITIIEYYNSISLLEWISAGLVADGLIVEDDRSSVFELRDTKITYQDVDYESYGNIELDKLQDHRFTEISFKTTPLENGEYHRDITYQLPEKAEYNSDQEDYDAFFAELEDAGMTVSRDEDSTGVTWVVGFDAADESNMVSKTNTALVSEETVFRKEVEMDSGHRITKIYSGADCTNICRLNHTIGVDEISPPPGASEDMTTVSTVYLDSGGESWAEFIIPLTYSEITTDTTVDVEGPVTFTAKITAANIDLDGLGEDHKNLLSRAGRYSVDVEEGDETTTFTVKITGETPGAFVASFNDWTQTGDASLSVQEIEDGEYDYDVSGYLPIGGPLIFYAPDSITSTLTIVGDNLEFHHEEGAEAPESDDLTTSWTDTVSNNSFHVTLDKKAGLPLALIIGVGVGLLVLILLIVFIGKLRSKKSAAATTVDNHAFAADPAMGFEPQGGFDSPAGPAQPGGYDSQSGFMPPPEGSTGSVPGTNDQGFAPPLATDVDPTLIAQQPPQADQPPAYPPYTPGTGQSPSSSTPNGDEPRD